MAWTAATSNQERSCGQSPKCSGRTPQELPIASPPPWKTLPRPAPASASKLPSTSVLNSSSSGSANSFQPSPEIAARMAEIFSSESAATLCSSKLVPSQRKAFRRPWPQRLNLNPPPYRAWPCRRPRPALHNRASRLRGQPPSPISLILFRACRPLPEVLP
jgi:hypothetical protein